MSSGIVRVKCGHKIHRILYRGGKYVLLDHPDLPAELALRALGSPPRKCVEFLCAVRAHRYNTGLGSDALHQLQADMASKAARRRVKPQDPQQFLTLRDSWAAEWTVRLAQLALLRAWKSPGEGHTFMVTRHRDVVASVYGNQVTLSLDWAHVAYRGDAVIDGMFVVQRRGDIVWVLARTSDRAGYMDRTQIVRGEIKKGLICLSPSVAVDRLTRSS